MRTFPNLHDCQNIKQCLQFHSRQSRKFQNYANRSADYLSANPDDVARLNSLFGEGNFPPLPVMSNRHVRRMAIRTMYKALRAVRKDQPDAEFMWITIISEDWQVSDEVTTIDLYSISSQARKTLAAISPNFIAAIEETPFSNARDDVRGKILSPHVHAIVWGPDARRRAVNVEAAHAGRYSRSFTQAQTIKVKSVGRHDIDIARLATYMFKPPSCKNHYVSKDGSKRNNHEGDKNIRYVRYLRLAQIYSMISIDNAVFGGGEGSIVRNAVIKSVKAMVALKTVPGKELVHRDAIPNFWAEMMPRLKQARFELPFIRTRR